MIFKNLYQVNNQFLHQSYLKSPLPRQINLIKNAKNHFLLLKKLNKYIKCPALASDRPCPHLVVPGRISGEELGRLGVVRPGGQAVGPHDAHVVDQPGADALPLGVGHGRVLLYPAAVCCRRLLAPAWPPSSVLSLTAGQRTLAPSARRRVVVVGVSKLWAASKLKKRFSSSSADFAHAASLS